MNELVTTISRGFTAFAATNLDDIVILLLFFSQVGSAFRRRQIVAGQYLGFTALVLASLPCFFGSLLLPRPWIGMLGLVPIAIGISRLVLPDEGEESTEIADDAGAIARPSWLSSVLSPQTYSVAAVTFANGGDNVGIYMPMFASSSWDSLLVTLAVFFVLVGVWCLIAYQLTRVPAIAHALTRYGNALVPFVLMGLGVLILIDSHTLENRGLAALSMVILGMFVIHLSRTLARAAANLPGAIAPKSATPQVENG